MDKKLKEWLDKFLSVGLGLVDLTREKAKILVDELVKKGEIPKEKSEKVIDEISKKGEKARSQLENLIEKKVQKMLRRIGVATKEDLEELKKKVKEMEKKTS